MLTLMRKTGQSVRLTLPDGREITVRVARVQRGKVYLAIEAPRVVRVIRSELAEGVWRVNGKEFLSKSAAEDFADLLEANHVKPEVAFVPSGPAADLAR